MKWLLTAQNIRQMLLLAGVGQVILSLGSLAIPHILSWRKELAKVQPLIRQMFWTYAAYILVINFCFALVSLLARYDLTNKSTLAVLVNAFIALYWISRIGIQFLYFDRSHFPGGIWHKVGEVLLVALFFLLSIVYSCAFYFNLTQS
ncbi:hypothetical protein [Mucilaginibacter sp. PAMB04168]|uniref:hypothetical protein n=1 Tax=Mucilaginibacter sp. PAMB04168 TaxID=3138567 RepID=UPI0031F6C5DD